MSATLEPSPTKLFIARRETANFSLYKGSVELPNHHTSSDYELRVPHELGSSVVRVMMPGLGEIIKLFRGTAEALAAREHVANIIYAPSRRGGVLESLTQPQRVHEDTLSAILAELSDNKEIDELPNGDKLDRGHVVLGPHSMSAMAATKRALEHPSEVRHIHFIQPVGFEAPRRARYVNSRIQRSLVKELLPAFVRPQALGGYVSGPELVARSVGFFGENIVRTAGEIISIHQADQRDALGALGEVASFFLGGQDILVPPGPTLESIAHIGIPYVVDPDADHLVVQKRPVPLAEALSALAEQAISRFGIDLR